MDRPIPYQYIAIEGNIGAGKTTLAKMLAKQFGARLILEQFADNPFLPFFYEQPERYSFPVELFFMTERHKQLQENLSQQDLFYSFTIADYYFLKTLLFAKINLNEEEFRLFQRLFKILNASFPKPELIVYLHKSPEKLKQNIIQRGRTYEQNISDDYLKKIQDTYFDFFRIDGSIPILIFNTDKMDFLNNTAHYDQILQSLQKQYNPGMHTVSFLY